MVNNQSAHSPNLNSELDFNAILEERHIHVSLILVHSVLKCTRAFLFCLFPSLSKAVNFVNEIGLQSLHNL